MIMAKKIVVLGAGESGVGAAVLALKEGYEVFVSDMSAIESIVRKLVDERKVGVDEMMRLYR